MEEKTAFITVHIQFRESIFGASQPDKSIYSCLQTTKLGLTLREVQERQPFMEETKSSMNRKRIRLYCLSERLSILS